MIEIKSGSSNFYANLNVPDADTMLLKVPLDKIIDKIIQIRGWSQRQGQSGSA